MNKSFIPSALSGFRIFKNEPLQETFRRILQEEIRNALLLCQRFSDEPEFTTHELRKSGKRIRAIYRIFRTAMGTERYVHGREVFSEMGRLLSQHRVSTVNMATLQILGNENRLAMHRHHIGNLMDDMHASHQTLTHWMLAEQKTGTFLTEMLTRESVFFSTDPGFSCDYRQLVTGIGSTYASARKRLSEAVTQPGTHQLHALRKAVKALWNAAILARPVWPSYMAHFVRQLDILAGRLGMEHDLAELATFLHKFHANQDVKVTKDLIHMIDQKSRRLKKLILPHALKLFAEKPAAFRQRIWKYSILFSDNNQL